MARGAAPLTGIACGSLAGLLIGYLPLRAFLTTLVTFILGDGDMEVDGRPLRYDMPRDAVKHRIICVTEDSKRGGFFEPMPAAENLHSGLLAAGQERLPYISLREMRQLAAEWSSTPAITAVNDNARVVELSGGNQQKPVIGRGLIQKPGIVLFDEPTRGVDVGAIAKIHNRSTSRRMKDWPRWRFLPTAGNHESFRPHPGLPPGTDRGRVLAQRRHERESHVFGGALIALYRHR